MVSASSAMCTGKRVPVPPPVMTATRPLTSNKLLGSREEAMFEIEFTIHSRIPPVNVFYGKRDEQNTVIKWLNLKSVDNEVSTCSKD